MASIAELARTAVTWMQCLFKSRHMIFASLPDWLCWLPDHSRLRFSEHNLP
ncbi:hypothetical protein Fuma_04705 [Fuerstiella marisgermanici]|uniref:Uncharacterized protein n=1 Tax=Fuerstiella marisgermanici TaxID=1891926 RepID=A0A1P8WLV8_9PLAN|nr:hypothetical protein Fuma_04705 [Fuerstiella marisgermanici]